MSNNSSTGSNDLNSGTKGTRCAYVTPLHRNVVMWHRAHLEYGCGADLEDVDFCHWNQDEEYGGFKGSHGIIKSGFSTLIEILSIDLNIKTNQIVEFIKASNDGIKIYTKSGI